MPVSYTVSSHGRSSTESRKIVSNQAPFFKNDNFLVAAKN